MKLLLAGLTLAGLALTQDPPYDPIYDAKFKHEKALKKLPGVLDVTVGGAAGNLRLVVRVENDKAAEAVRAYCGGDALDGFPVYVLGGRAPAPPAAEPACARCPLHCGRPGPGPTVAAPAAPAPGKIDLSRLHDPAYAQERCDIIRKWSGQPKLKHGDAPCTEMIGWTTDSKRLKWIVEQDLPNWPSKEMPGTTCYTWIKHRQFCPLGMRQVLKEIDDLTPTQGSRP
jgi:hypothetical protein